MPPLRFSGKLNATDKFLWYWAPVLAFCAALFVQSSYPSIKTGLSFVHQDKLLHVIAYGVLAVLFYRAGWVTWAARLSPRQLFWISACFAGLYGVSDEIHQAFVPSRQFDIYDLLADIAGGVVGAAGSMKYWGRRWKLPMQ